MAARIAALAGALLLAGFSLTSLSPVVSAPNESAELLPAGPGREEAFSTCSACHAYQLVAAQSMSRERWDETMTLMTEKHGMPKLQVKERKVILDYLARTHPPKKATGTGGFQIPFVPH